VRTDVVAMHISNGIIGIPVSAIAGLIAVAGLAWCITRARADLDDRLAPMAGLVAAFIFAVQMLNFPVLPGVSGHLLGGALAALLVGPYVGAICVSLVLAVQALLFADGGLSALGLNIVNMGLVGTFVAYLLAAALLGALPKNSGSLVATAWITAVVSVVVASQAFVLEYALGGTTDLSTAGIAGTIGGFHLLIGVGEGFITAITVGTVAKVRPDLVHALRGRRQPLRIATIAPERAA
jgi:cobalt/nickel transport system permease protein